MDTYVFFILHYHILHSYYSDSLLFIFILITSHRFPFQR